MPARPKIVLDTNVLVSSLWRGRPWKLVRLWRDERFRLVVSDPVLQEYLEVLGRFVSLELLQEWADLLTDPLRVILVTPTERLDLIPEDPADNRFLECAVAGRVDALVSGDRHLLKLNAVRQIPIVPPAVFLRRHFPDS